MPDHKKFQRGARIISKGDQATAAFLLKQGKVIVFIEKDEKTVTLAELGPGAIFGENALFDGKEYGANIEAAEETEVQVITPGSFQEKIETCDPMLRALITMLIERLKRTNEALVDSETREFMEIALI